MENIDYGSLDCLGDTVDIDLLQFSIEKGSVLDEVPEIDRFVSLSDFLKRGDDNYQKWGVN